MYTTTTTYTTTSPTSLLSTILSSMFGAYFWITVILLILLIVSFWKIFIKANKPGWASIIPVYNVLVELEIIERPVWWIILLFVPIVNAVVGIIIALDLASRFGKSAAWAIFLLIIFPYIGYPIMAFDQTKYQAKGSSAPAQDIPPANQVADSKL